MMQKLFWYKYNKGRTKCCHILKAHRFSLMIYNYMDISLMLNFFFFSFLMRFFKWISCRSVHVLDSVSSCGKRSKSLIFVKNFFYFAKNLASLFIWSDSVIPTRETKFPDTAIPFFDWNVSSETFFWDRSEFHFGL